MNFKNQLRLYLIEKNMTASELARVSGVPKQSISDWLGGTDPRNIRFVKKIADTLEVSLDHLMFGTGIKSKAQAVPVEVSNIGEDWVEGLFEVKLRRIKQ